MKTRGSGIVIIAGAGASIAAGAPGTAELLDAVLSSFPDQRLIKDINGVETIENAPMSSLLRRSISQLGNGEADFEIVMACVEQMIAYGMPGNVGQLFMEPREAFVPVLHTGMLQSAYATAVRSLITTFLLRPAQNQQQTYARESLVMFIKRLAARHRIVLATLNYDVLLDDALQWADGFTPVAGWDFAQFDPLLWRTQLPDSPLLMHLHGSLRFGFRPITALFGDASFSEPVRYALPETAANSVFGTSVGPPSADGVLLPATPIVVGGHKSPKLMHNVRPYAYYNATMIDVIAAADALVIIGYSFRDEHVNAWISEYLRLHPNGPLVLITKRTGRDVAESTAVERFLMKMSKGGIEYDQIYEPIEGGLPSSVTHGRLGSMYLVAGGTPMDDAVQECVITYLLNSEAITTNASR
jgi:hypothetical protein